MAKILFFGAFLLLILAVLAFLFIPKRFHREFPRGQVKAGDHILKVDIADTAALRSTGLSDHAPLASDEGMYFIFPIPAIYPFWMKGMEFPLDIVWIRGEKIVGIAEGVAIPGSGSVEIYSPPVLVDRVLELSAGAVKALGLKEGGVVKLIK